MLPSASDCEELNNNAGVISWQQSQARHCGDFGIVNRLYSSFPSSDASYDVKFADGSTERYIHTILREAVMPSRFGVIVSDAGLAALVRACVHLMPDNIVSTYKGDLFLAAVSQVHPTLQHINLRRCGQVTATGIESLARVCTRLTSIDLTSTQATDESLALLMANNPKLLPDSVLSKKKGGAFLAAVAKQHSTLQEINLSGCKQVTDAGLRMLGNSCTSLTKIDLTECTVSDAGLAELVRACPDLLPDKIHVQNGIKGDQFLLAVAERHPTIEHLDVSGCKAVTDIGLEALARQCTGLTDIDICGCCFTEAGLLTLLSSAKNLRRLRMDARGELSDSVFSGLAAGCPELERVELVEGTASSQEGPDENLEVPYELTMSAQYDGPPNTFESLRTTDMSKGAATNRSRGSYIEAKLPTETNVQGILLGGPNGKMPGGWSVGYIHKCKLQYYNGSAWADCGDESQKRIKALKEDKTSFIPLDITTTSLRFFNDDYVSIGCLQVFREPATVSEDGLVSLVIGCPKLLPDSILCSAKGDKFLAAVAKQHPGLQQISLLGCSEVTDTGLAALAAGCAGLADIDLAGCPKITEAGLCELVSRCPGLHPDKLPSELKADAFVAAVARGQPELTEIDLMPKNIKKQFESAHPYPPDARHKVIVDFPGAASLSFSFDSRCKTEGSCDYVRILKGDGADENVFWGADKYCTGKKNWPGVNGEADLVVPDSKCVIYFYSDRGNQDWGWKCTVTPETRAVTAAGLAMLAANCVNLNPEKVFYADVNDVLAIWDAVAAWDKNTTRCLDLTTFPSIPEHSVLLLVDVCGVARENIEHSSNIVGEFDE